MKEGEEEVTNIFLLLEERGRERASIRMFLIVTAVGVRE